MNPLSKLLFAAALLLGAVGAVVAVVQPGDLGDDPTTEAAQIGEGAGTSSPTTEAPSSSTSSSSTTTTTPTTSTPTTESGPAAAGGSDGEPAEGPVVEGDSTAAEDGSTGDGSAAGGSGLDGGDDTPDDLDDGLAATGGTSAMGLALVAAAAGLALHRRGPGRQRSHG